MATTTYNHCQIGVVDATGNVDVVYPQNTGDDVQISRTNNSQIPSDVSTSQDLADKLGSLAFKSALSVSNFATGVVTTATNITSAGYLADARAIATLTNRVTELSSNVDEVNKNLEIEELVLTKGSYTTLIGGKAIRQIKMVSLSLIITIKGTVTTGLGIAIIKNVNPFIDNNNIPCVYRNTGSGNTTSSSVSIGKYGSDAIILCDSSNTSFDEVRINTTFMIK